MSKKKPAAAASPPDIDFQWIPPDLIDPSPINPRQTFDDEDMAELEASVAENGILQNLLVRPTGGGRYELIAGERRLRAAIKAGLPFVPCRAIWMEDDKAHELRIIENLQRKDLHPMEEAEGFARLAEMKAIKDIAELARRVARDPKYVAGSLSLLTLIEPVRDDYRKGLIDKGHALLIAKLQPEVQQEALDACYEQKYGWDQKTQRQWYEPDREKPARSVAKLLDWINHNLTRDLTRVPWSLEDAALLPSQGACATCPANTASNKLLFGDAAQKAICTNPEGFERKMRAWIQRKADEIAEKDKRPAVLLSEIYNLTDDERARHKLPPDAIGRNQYEVVERKAERCAQSRRGVFVEGSRRGQLAWVCMDVGCKEHRGRYNSSVTKSSGVSADAPEVNAAELLKKRERRQELFDLRVAEKVRKQIFKDVLPSFTWPLDREWLNRVAAEFFVRIPFSETRVIYEVLGREDLPSSHHDIATLMKKVAAMTDDELAQFFALCSFAHYGANEGLHHWKDQKQVVKLADERGADYALRDAEQRHEDAGRKYKEDHFQYLEAVRGGRVPKKKPIIYEVPQPPTLVEAKPAEVKASSKKAAKSSSKKSSSTRAAKKGAKRPAK